MSVIRLFVLGATLAALALRLLRLNESFWLDEALSMAFADRSLLATVGDAWPPVYRLLMHVWLHAVGREQEWLARLPSVLAGAAVIPLLYATGARLFDRRSAALAVGWAAVSAFQLEYSQEARYYACLQLLIVLSTYAYVRVRAGGGGGWLAVYTIAGVAAVETHYFGLPSLAAQAVHTLWFGPGLRIAWRWLAGMALAVGIVALRLWIFRSHEAGGDMDPMEWLQTPAATAPLATLAEFLGWGWHGWGPGLAAISLLAAAWFGRSAAVSGEHRRSARGLVWLLSLGVVMVPIVVSWSLAPIFHRRYVIAAAPLAYLALAQGLLAIPWTGVRRGVIALCTALSLVGTFRYFATPQKPDWREVAVQLSATAGVGEIIWVAPGGHMGALDWYYRGPALLCPLVRPGSRPPAWMSPDCRLDRDRMSVVALAGVRRREPGILDAVDALVGRGWQARRLPGGHGLIVRQLDRRRAP